jgi:predicted CxxxxCH...CXXCH cytochrome family protein
MHRRMLLVLWMALPACLDAEQPAAPGCNTCHGTPGGNAAPPQALGSITDPTYPWTGTHQAHLLGATLGRSIACVQCHTVPATIDAPGHIDDAWPAEVTWGELAAANGRQPSWQRETRTCGNTYCHSGVAGGSTMAPQWDDLTGARNACTSCHGMPPPAPHPGNSSCENCHGAVAGPESTLADPTLHVDGTVQFN